MSFEVFGRVFFLAASFDDNFVARKSRLAAGLTSYDFCPYIRVCGQKLGTKN